MKRPREPGASEIKAPALVPSGNVLNLPDYPRRFPHNPVGIVGNGGRLRHVHANLRTGRACHPRCHDDLALRLRTSPRVISIRPSSVIAALVADRIPVAGSGASSLRPDPWVWRHPSPDFSVYDNRDSQAMGGKSKHLIRGRKRPPTFPWCQKVDGRFRAPISVADFAVPERRLAIYIDGAAFHTGDRYRRDRFIRRRLREADPPWRVEELRATDLGQGAQLVERLREV